VRVVLVLLSDYTAELKQLLCECCPGSYLSSKILFGPASRPLGCFHLRQNHDQTSILLFSTLQTSSLEN
jgi:hypothetical protein